MLFVLNPRTASTAISAHLGKHLACRWLPQEDILQDNGNILLQRKHSTVKELLDHGLLSQAHIQSIKKFTVVRNPFDSIVSFWVKKRFAYADLAKDKNFFGYKLPGFMEDMQYVQDHSFSEWLLEKFTKNLPEGGSINKRYMHHCDQILRYENLWDDLDSLLKSCGVELPEVPLMNETKHKKPYREYYTPEARRAVERHFSFDIDVLKYQY